MATPSFGDTGIAFRRARKRGREVTTGPVAEGRLAPQSRVTHSTSVSQLYSAALNGIGTRHGPRTKGDYAAAAPCFLIQHGSNEAEMLAHWSGVEPALPKRMAINVELRALEHAAYTTEETSSLCSTCGSRRFTLTPILLPSPTGQNANPPAGSALTLATGTRASA